MWFLSILLSNVGSQQNLIQVLQNLFFAKIPSLFWTRAHLAIWLPSLTLARSLIIGSKPHRVFNNRYNLIILTPPAQIWIKHSIKRGTQIEKIRPNLQTKNTKSKLPNQTYQTRPTKQTLSNKTYQTKPNKTNLLNQTYQT